MSAQDVLLAAVDQVAAKYESVARAALQAAQFATDALEAERAKVAALEEANAYLRESNQLSKQNMRALLSEAEQENDRLHERLWWVLCGGAWDAGVAEAYLEAADRLAVRLMMAIEDASDALRGHPDLEGSPGNIAAKILRAALEAP